MSTIGGTRTPEGTVGGIVIYCEGCGEPIPYRGRGRPPLYHNARCKRLARTRAPQVEEVTVDGESWTTVDAAQLFAYLRAKAIRYGSNEEARDAVMSVLDDLNEEA
jgi:hypothetical protein